MENSALLVVDVQNALVSKKPYAVEEVIKNIKELINAARNRQVEVIYIQHTGKAGSEFELNSESWKIIDEIKPEPDDMVIVKQYNSAFKDTTLKAYLENRGIKEIILTGLQTDLCVDATIKSAFENSFRVIVPEKTNSTYDSGNISAKDLYEYFNFRIFKNRYATVEPLEDTIRRWDSEVNI